MNFAVVAVRAVYFIAALQLFGWLNYALFFAAPARRRVIWWLAAVTLATLAVWLALEAGAMSGESIAAALSDGTLGTVLWDTRFGIFSLARAALLLGVAILVGWRGRPARIAATVAAAGTLALSAATGHAGADGSTTHLIADMIHLLAAGAWLGGLVPFSLAMARSRAVAQTGAEARRFSTLGIVCVGAILVTGGINGWFLVGNFPALIGTPYGRLLLVKLALFVTMVPIAAFNRYRLTPSIRAGDRAALPALRRNALIEVALGFAILMIIAMLGTLPPAYDAAAG